VSTQFREQANKTLIHRFYSTGFLRAGLAELIYSASSGKRGLVQVGQVVCLWQSQFSLSGHGAAPLNYLRLLTWNILALKMPVSVPGVWRVVVCVTILTREMILRSIQSSALKHNRIG